MIWLLSSHIELKLIFNRPINNTSVLVSIIGANRGQANVWAMIIHFTGWDTLQWHHNERDGVSNHRSLDCLLNCLFRRRSMKTSKLRVNGLCEGNRPVTGRFPLQKARNAVNVSIWWHHHKEKGHVKVMRQNAVMCINVHFISTWSILKVVLYPVKLTNIFALCTTEIVILFCNIK